ncbi:MAG TPA: translocation/assembly module TamB domain-containing protein [Candidatus Sulfotelmatobacter sp.]|jgi:translocation and assembly module TamB
MKWKRIIGWLLASLLGLVIVAVIAGYFVLRSSRFQQYALQTIANQARQATGARTEIGGLDLSLSKLTAHLYNITVHGTEKATQSPLLHVDNLTVSLKIVSVLRHQIALRQLLIDHPVVYLQVGKDGRNNLPAAPPSTSGSHTSVFDLAVAHAQLMHGEINYNDRSTPLEADLHDLRADIRFAAFAKRYDGELSYTDGHLRYAQYAPLPHSLNLAFSADPERLDLKSTTLRIGASNLTLQAEVTNYANPVAKGTYAIRIHTPDFAEMSPGIEPAGDVAFTGSLQYQAVANAPLLREVKLDGRVASEQLTALASRRRIELKRLQGSYQLVDGNLRLTDVNVESLGGHIMAAAEIAHLDGTPDAHIRTSLHDISLRALQQTLGTQQLKGALLTGTISGRGEARWKGGIGNLRSRSDLTIQARAVSTATSLGEEVPVNGWIHASYDGPSQTVELRDTTLTLPSITLKANGKVGDRSNLLIQIVGADLHQAASLASAFAPQNTIPAISGSATLTALIRGSMKAPEISAQLKGQNIQVEGSEWTNVQAAVFADPSKLTVQNATLINAHRGQATFNASVALRDWSYDPADSIHGNLDVRQMRIADLLQLANQHYPLAGDLSAKFKVEGSQINPSGSGSAQIANAQVYGEPIQNLSTKFQAQNGSIAATLNVTANAGAIDANLSYAPKTKNYNLRLNAPSVVLQKLQTVQAKNLGLIGTVSVSVNGQGTLDDPQLTATVQLPQLQIRRNSIGNLKTELQIAKHSADLTLDSTIVQASIHARGHVALNGNYDTDAAIDTGTIPLQALLATYAPSAPQGVQGQAELHANFKGPLKDLSRAESHVSIPVFNASYQSLQIGIAQPIRIDYSNSVVTLQPAELKGTDTSLRIQGRVPLAGNSAPSLTAQGSVDLRILQIVAPDVQSSGALALDLHATGTGTSPSIQGQMQLKDVALGTADAPVGVAKLNGTIDIGNDRLQFTKMTGDVGGGEVTLGGSITYRPSVQFNLAMQTRSVRLLYPDGLRSSLEANLAYGGTMQASTLSGHILLKELSFTPDFDLSKIADQFSTSNAVSQPGFADSIKLAIAVQSQDLNATSSQISIAGTAALRVGGTAANPVITGRTTLSSGELFYRNLRYQLQNGAITFDNPIETHPVLNMSVSTTVEQYNLTLGLRGPLDKLATSYTSDPPLATADIINLIARGKTTQESAAQSTSTDSMIASQAASEVSGSLQKLAGISSLQIDPTIGGNGQSPSTQIAIQQRVTKNLLFTFSTDVSQPGSEIVQGEYQLNKQWSVSLERDQLGGFSADGRYHKRF